MIAPIFDKVSDTSAAGSASPLAVSARCAGPRTHAEARPTPEVAE